MGTVVELPPDTPGPDKRAHTRGKTALSGNDRVFGIDTEKLMIVYVKIDCYAVSYIPAM